MLSNILGNIFSGKIILFIMTTGAFNEGLSISFKYIEEARR